MPEFEIDLGQAALHSRKSAVCIDVQSSATFAASEKDDVDQLRSRLTVERSTDVTNEKPWVRCGDEFKLVLSIQTGDVLGADEMNELRETLSSRLQEAKMWQQLLLTPVSSLSSSNDIAGILTIATNLARAESIPATTHRRHKLDVDVPFFDVRPPPGVVDVPCKTVHVKLLLSQQQLRLKRKWRNSEPLRNGHTTVASGGEDNFSSQHLNGGDGFLDILEDGCAHLHDDGPFVEHQESSLVDEDHKSECGLLEVAQLPSDGRPELFNQASEQNTSVQHGSTSTGPATKSHISCPGIDELLHAIEAALKAVLAGTSRHSVNGFSAERCSIHPLSAVAPAIWSPGYLASVAKRCVFIPTIAHAISTVLGASVKKASEDSAVKAHPKVERPSFAGASAACSLDTRIWDFMLNGLNEGTGARKLSLLSETSDGGAASQGKQEELLDCWEADRDDADSLDIAEENYIQSVPHGETDEMLEGESNLRAKCDVDHLLLAEGLEDCEGLGDGFYFETFDLRSRDQPLGAIRKPRSHPSSTPDHHLDLAKAEVKSIWQSEDFVTLMSTLSQRSSMPSQSRHCLADFTSCDAKKDHYCPSRTEEDVWLPQEEGESVAVKDDLMFEDCIGDEVLMNEAVLGNLPSDDCEMLLL